MEKKRKEWFSFFFWKILGYFIIYSVLGYVAETFFGFVTKGVWESRQSFLYGPFCGIYGLGALVLIFSLKPFEKNKFTLFLGGFLVGSVVEYAMSLAGEWLFNVKWWDYSGEPLNLNGRICMRFSIYWGVLGVFLISYMNPAIEKLAERIKQKISHKWLKAAELALCLFLIFDISVTGVALKAFYIRMVVRYDVKVNDKVKMAKQYQKLYSHETTVSLVDRFLGDEKMMKTFPNLKLEDTDGQIIYFGDLLTEGQQN